MKKKIFFTLLTLLNMGLIFFFSSQNGQQSNITSDFVAKFIPLSIFIIRKSAHFLIYALLEFNTYQMLKSYNIHRAFLFSLLICILYAISDEWHQSFSNGRSPQARDVCIDTLGSLFMISLLKLKDKSMK